MVTERDKHGYPAVGPNSPRSFKRTYKEAPNDPSPWADTMREPIVLPIKDDMRYREAIHSKESPVKRCCYLHDGCLRFDGG